MFGQVPKTLWSKRIEPDSKNRIPLCSRLLVVETGKDTILIETGCGRKWSDKLLGIYDISYRFDQSLADVVQNPNYVFLTHLHFDHAAGLVSSAGELEFPDATHVISEANYQVACNPPPRERASYLAENIDPLSKANLHLAKDGEEIVPGISVHQVHGHTEGMQYVKLVQGDQVVVFPADLVPTSHHVDGLWVMGYDARAALSVEEKTDFLSKAVEENWLIVFGHDRDVATGRIEVGKNGKFLLQSI